jgi:putative hemolysin
MLPQIHHTAVSVAERELLRIPVSGACILLANRPSTHEQERRMYLALQQRRNDWVAWHRKGKGPDGKTRKDFWYSRAKGQDAASMGIPEAQNALAAASHLKRGGALIVFPNRPGTSFAIHKPGLEVLSFSFGQKRKETNAQLRVPFWSRPWALQDGKWSKAQMQLVQEAEVPVVPMFWNPEYETIFTKGTDAHFPLSLRMGQRLSPKLLARLEHPASLQRYLRARVQCLGLLAQDPGLASSRGKENAPKHPFLRVVQTPFDGRCLKAEIDALPTSACVLSRGDFDVFHVRAEAIPNVLYEIGRLREIAFQAEGEGSRNPIDLDEYDATYRHLFAWDRKEGRLVGAYRLGLGPELLAQQGKRGFYLHSLFHMKDGLLEHLQHSMELGRSFVVPEYQQQRLPLFLLWQGIVASVRQYPDLKYLIGPVSISNRYSRFSRSLMVRYIRTHHFDSSWAAFVRPRKAFRPDFGGLDAEALLSLTDVDTKPIDGLIADLEPSHFRMPVLLRQYFAQHARIIGFNVDPDFSDALDGFMVCRIEDLGQAYQREQPSKASHSVPLKSA